MEEQTSTPIIQGAHDAADRLKAENDRFEANLRRFEELKAYETLGGKSEGKSQEQKPKEETPAEYAERVMRGGK